jgi:hypothetical protein
MELLVQADGAMPEPTADSHGIWQRVKSKFSGKATAEITDKEHKSGGKG